MTDTAKGYWLGTLGVTVFALTLPMTRLAVGTGQSPQLSGGFVAMGRAVVAAVLSALFLAATGGLKSGRRPSKQQWVPLLLTSAGVVFGFPLLTSIAMRHVEAVHASVMTGILPLATAAVGAVLERQRPPLLFWLCAAVGSILVIAFALLKSGSAGFALHPADMLLLFAMLCASVGYGYGARLSRVMPPSNVICWALICGLPVTLPLSILLRPVTEILPSAWAAFSYVAVFSMWLGFFAWYRALALGGMVRVSQVQLIQPFLSMMFAVPLLGEKPDAFTLGFGLAVIAVVFAGKRIPVHRSVRPIEPGN